MRRLVIGASTLAAALVLGAAPASAQFYVGAYASLPSSDFGDFAKTGWMAEAGFQLFESANEKLSFYVAGAYGMNKLDSDLVDGDYTQIMGLGHVVYDLTAGGSATPYLIGSAGYLSVKEDIEGVGDETNGGLTFGGGLGLGFSSRFWVEGRYMTASIDDVTFGQIIIGGGVSF